MDILKTKLGTVLKVTLLIAVLFSFSCSKDDDASPTPGTTFVALPASALGTYTGALTYTTPTNPMPTENVSGTATITSTGDNVYSITFSDGIPELTGFRFISSNGTYASADATDSSEGVSISGADLSVGLTKNGSNWSFSGSK